MHIIQCKLRSHRRNSQELLCDDDQLITVCVCVCVCVWVGGWGVGGWVEV